jgi:glycolate oxidase
LYRPVDEAVLRHLIEISGSKAVFTDEEAREKYSRDETPGLSHRPEAVIMPATSNEIMDIVRLANSENTPVTPRGMGPMTFS